MYACMYAYVCAKKERKNIYIYIHMHIHVYMHAYTEDQYKHLTVWLFTADQGPDQKGFDTLLTAEIQPQPWQWYLRIWWLHIRKKKHTYIDIHFI